MARCSKKGCRGEALVYSPKEYDYLDSGLCQKCEELETRIIHEGRGWSLYVNGKRRLYEESFGVVSAVEGCLKDPNYWPCSEADEIAQGIKQ